MDIDLETLIELTRERPVLWDQKDLNYYNRGAIEKAWLEISTLMKAPPEPLRKKWKYLRDQFRVESRKIPEDKFLDDLLNVTDCDEYVKWPFYKVLFFLKSQIKYSKLKNKSRMNATAKEMDFEDENTQEVEVEISSEQAEEFGKMFLVQNVRSILGDGGFEETSQPMSMTNQSVSERNRGRDDDIDDRLQRLETQLDAAIAESHCQNKRKYFDDDQEEDRAFFTSILPHIKRLTPAKKMLCRIDIQNIVYKYAYRNDRTRGKWNIALSKMDEN